MSTFKLEVEERLVGFAASVLKATEHMPEDITAGDLVMEIIDSGTAPALHYADAQSADSSGEFLKKLKQCLDDLRKTQIRLRIVKHLLGEEGNSLDPVIEDCGQLIALFAKSVKTKKDNMSSEKKEKAEAV